MGNLDYLHYILVTVFKAKSISRCPEEDVASTCTG